MFAILMNRGEQFWTIKTLDQIVSCFALGRFISDNYPLFPGHGRIVMVMMLASVIVVMRRGGDIIPCYYDVNIM